MPLGDVVLRILGRDDTGEATASAEGNVEQLERSWVRSTGVMTAAAARFAAEVLESFAGIARDVEQRFTDLNRDIGRVSTAAHDLRAQLVGYGADPGADLNEIVATVDAQLGGADQPGAAAIAAHLANFGRVTGFRDPRVIGEIARQFGIGGPEVAPFLDLTAAQITSRRLRPAETLTSLREYGPVLQALGLSPLESVEFVGDLLEQGISVSRVSPAINLAIRNAAEEGAAPSRQVIGDALRQIREAPTDDAAVAAATPIFGAEGTLRFVQGVRRGNVGLGPQQLALGHLGLQETTASLREPTADELIAIRRRQLEEGDLLDRLALGIVGAAGAIPIIGDPLTQAFDTVLGYVNRPRPERQTVVQVYGSVIDTGELSDITRNGSRDNTALLPTSP